MNAADALRTFLAPLLPGWRLQFGAWHGETKTDRFAVLRPIGGLPVSLLREPQFSLSLIGAVNDDAAVVSGAAETFIEATRSSSGALVLIQPAEPVFRTTDDGRPVAECSISTITT